MGEPHVTDRHAARQHPRVLIVSETRLYREGLAEALARAGSLDICGHSDGAKAALDALGELTPDVMLLDAAISNGPEFAAAIAKAAPQTRIVVMALAEAPSEVLSWVEAGATGYIPRSTSLMEVARTVLEIVDGSQSCAPRVTSALLQRLRKLSAVAGNGPNDINGTQLTARELQIARFIAAGMSNKQIARQLDLSLATIKSHVHNLLGKLEVQRRGQVVGRLGAHSRCSPESSIVGWIT
jgi:two-component system nitrate/nitrite response regulator NarL